MWPQKCFSKIGPRGTLNALGNVRDWVWNLAGNTGHVLGGGWSDCRGTCTHAYTAWQMGRLPEYEMRAMGAPRGASVASTLLEPIQLSFDSAYANRHPVSDDAFTAMRFQSSAAHRKPKSPSQRFPALVRSTTSGSTARQRFTSGPRGRWP